MEHFYRNNAAQCVVRVADDGCRYVRTFDEQNQLATAEIEVGPQDPRANGAVGVGKDYPLTEIDRGGYEAFGYAWRYTTRNGRVAILLDERLYGPDHIVRNRTLDDLYNDGAPYDDIFEHLGVVSSHPSLSYPAAAPHSISIEQALRIAIDAHEGQTDLDGLPVILHPLTVGLVGRNRKEMIAGFLHDVVEDTDLSFDDLREQGVDDDIVDALMLLTHDKKQQDYEQYVERIATSGNLIAMHVKFNDLKHNLTRGRAGGHWKQVAKHETALQRMQRALTQAGDAL